MLIDPASVIDFGLRTLMHNPFFDPTLLTLSEGESKFRVLERRDGLVVTLGPNTSFFDRPGRSVCRSPETETIPRQSPHPILPRSKIANEIDVFLRLFCGGGDVRFSLVRTFSKQQELLLTAGEGNVIEKIDLAELARFGASSLLFLQPAYLCSSSNVLIKSISCDASAMSWARAPYVYKARPKGRLFDEAILCLCGRTMVWCERLQPGESRNFALGNVIGATSNIRSTLRPTGQGSPDNRGARHAETTLNCEEDEECSFEVTEKRGVGRLLGNFAAASRVLLDTIRVREGFLVCELTNPSDKPAYVVAQLNKSTLYGGSGFVGFAVKLIADTIRVWRLSFSH